MNDSTPQDSPLTTYDRLLDALEAAGKAVQRNGGSARAQCPAHESKTTTSKPLSILSVPGRVLVYCHAGCNTEDVTAALNLEMADLFDSTGGVRYEYPKGRVVHRTPDKKFRQSGDTKDRSLYGSDEMGDHQTVYVVEGEQDVETVHSVGDAAVSPAMGAGTNPNKFDWNCLAGKDVVVVADRDDKGRRHAKDVAAHLVNIAKSVTVAEPLEGKDISDHITAGHKLEDLVTESLLDTLGVTSEWLETQTFPELEQIVPGLIVEGVTVLAGPPKVGKSFLVGNIAIAVVSGGKALGHIAVTGRPVLVLALEDGHRRLQSRYRQINDGPIPPGITFITKATPAECLSVIAEYLQRYGDRKPLIILDTLGRVKRHKQAGEESYTVDYELGAKFKTLAETCPGAAIVIIHHTRKADAADFVDLVSGTQGIAGSVDCIVTVNRKRRETEATLSVTGRDVMENEYALQVINGYLWTLDGETLTAASDRLDARREEAERARRATRLSPDMNNVLALVNQRGNITSEEITFKLKLTPRRVGQITSRLVEGDHIVRAGRGEYHSHAYEAAHPLIGGGESGVLEYSGVDGGGNTPDTPDTSLTTDTSLTPDSDMQEQQNTCKCGAPLTQPKSLETGLCTECRTFGRE